jgi:hypothetical protein
MFNKKIFFVSLFILIVLILSSCSGKTNEDTAKNHIEKSENETATINVELENKKVEPLISTEILDKIIYTSEYGGTTIYVAAIIKNTGNVPIDLGYISFDIENENGEFVKNIRRYTKSNPSVINPNENAFVCELDIDEKINAKDCKKIILNYDAKEINKFSTYYNYENIKVIPFSGHFYGISGRIINNTDQEVKDIIVAAVLYGENDKFLGVIKTYPLDKINIGGKLGFEHVNTPIPDNAFKLEKIKKIVPIVYN